MNKFRKNLAKNLRILRGKQSQSEFGRRLGVSQSSLNRIEQGEQNVSIDMLSTLCERLKCTPDDLLE